MRSDPRERDDDLSSRIRVWLLVLVACSAPAQPVAPAKPVVKKEPEKHITDLERPPEPKLLDIDWSTVKLDTNADALALWARIAPTGLDWTDKLDELPDAVERPLAIALVQGGNFSCTPAPAKRDCVMPPFDETEPTLTSTFTDPCLRRLLALWAVDKLEPADVAKLLPELRAMAALAPPESELVAAVLAAVPEDDHVTRLDLMDAAWKAGQNDLVNAAAGKLDEPHLIEAVTKHHIDGALEILSADAHRTTYLAAVTDEQLGARARTRAMFDLAAIDPNLAPDIKTALTKAVASKDCNVAATAARLLQQSGNARFVPSAANLHPRTTEQFMRAMCLLASYEAQQPADEASLLAGYVPKRGLERMTVTYDALSDVDTDGDGDPHTTHTAELVARDQIVLPEVEDLVKAMRDCKGTLCKSDDREFRFTFKAGQVTRLEVIERPPCPKP